MIFKSRNLVNFILNFFKLCCCYRLKVSAYIVRVQSGIALLTETRVLLRTLVSFISFHCRHCTTTT